MTGESFESSLLNARNRRNEYDYLVVVGGDGMIALGANAVGCSGKPLGIVAVSYTHLFTQDVSLILQYDNRDSHHTPHANGFPDRWPRFA